MPIVSSMRPLVKDPQRYKTVMCANWVKNGSCPYDFKCQFAHGAAELRERKTSSEKARANKKVTATGKAAPAVRAGKVSFIEGMISVATRRPSQAVEDAPDSTPLCSPCSSRSETPPPARPSATASPDAPPPTTTTSSAPSPATPAASPLTLPSTPPGLGIKPPAFAAKPIALPSSPVAVGAAPAALGAVRTSPAHSPVGPIDFAAAGGAAGRFATGRDFVPDGVASLWAEPSEAAESPLRCNPSTGKVEMERGAGAAGAPAVPWVTRRMSSAGELVRRAVSFVFDEDSLRKFSRRASEWSERRSVEQSERSTSGRNTDLYAETSEVDGAARAAGAPTGPTRAQSASPTPEWA